MKDLESMPIYLVVSEQVHIVPWSQNYLLKYIVQVIEGDIADMRAIYDQYIIPLYNQGRHIQVEMYLRQAPHPFENWKELELAQIKERRERDEQDRLDYLERTAKTEGKPGALPGD